MALAVDFKEKALQFLKTHTLAVLSTIGQDGNPDAAVIYVSVDDNFNFFFITKADTTKSKNLEKNHNAALTIFDPSIPITVQGKGTVQNMALDKEYSSLFLRTTQATMITGTPPLAKLNNLENFELYKFVPSWLRYGDFSEKPVVANTKESIFYQIIPETK